MINSTKNSHIKNLEKLKKSRKYRRETGLFIVEGIKSVREANLYCQVHSLYLSETRAGEAGGELKKRLIEDGLLSGNQDTIVEVVSDRVFSRISDTVTPQGILALVRAPVYDFDSMISEKELFLVILENLSDPGNMGTIIRTAEGAGADGIVLGKACADVFSPKVVRSAMGALFRMPFFEDTDSDFVSMLEKLKKGGVKLYGAHLLGREFYDNVQYGQKLGIVIGNESKGITKETSEFLDELVRIPMEGKVESLNASVAAGVLMYEIYRQRRNN